jgi:hypothetical protein
MIIYFIIYLLFFKKSSAFSSFSFSIIPIPNPKPKPISEIFLFSFIDFIFKFCSGTTTEI